MTIEDLKKMDKEILTPGDIAPVLGCDPNKIRFQANKDVNSFGFPVCKIASRIKIPRRAFIQWFENSGISAKHSCSVCGIVESDFATLYPYKDGTFLCSKHYKQILEEHKITDATPFSRKNVNYYDLIDNYAKVTVYNFSGEETGSFLIDAEDIEKCKKHKWSIKKHKNGYNTVVSETGKTKYSLHRYVLDYYGDMQVDHINRDPLDNRKQNLRIVSSCENNANKGKDNIYLQSNGKYKCAFRRYGKNYFVGYFDTYEEALKAKEKIIIEIENNKEKLQKEYYEKRNKAGTGVAPTPSGKWRAFYQEKGKLISVGVYDKMEDAQTARDEFIKSRAK